MSFSFINPLGAIFQPELTKKMRLCFPTLWVNIEQFLSIVFEMHKVIDFLLSNLFS